MYNFKIDRLVRPVEAKYRFITKELFSTILVHLCGVKNVDILCLGAHDVPCVFVVNVKLLALGQLFETGSNGRDLKGKKPVFLKLINCCMSAHKLQKNVSAQVKKICRG